MGPFHYVQAEGVLNWNALSVTDLRNYQSSKELERAAGFDLRNARDLVVLAVGGTYLQVVADAARVESQTTQVKYAQAVFDQSETQLAAGTNTRIDVSRSRVQLQTEQERLLSEEADLKQHRISLARLIGIPLDRDLVLTEPFGYHELQPVGESGGAARCHCPPVGFALRGNTSKGSREDLSGRTEANDIPRSLPAETMARSGSRPRTLTVCLPLPPASTYPSTQAAAHGPISSRRKPLSDSASRSMKIRAARSSRTFEMPSSNYKRPSDKHGWPKVIASMPLRPSTSPEIGFRQE